MEKKKKNGKEMAIYCVSSMDGITLNDFPQYRNDYDVVLAAVNKRGRNLQYASSKLQNNKEIVKAAVNNDSYSIVYAGDKFKLNRNYVLNAVKKYQTEYSVMDENVRFYISPKISNLIKYHKNDTEIVYEMAKCQGRAFSELITQMDKSFLKNNELIKMIVKNNPCAYADLLPEQRSDIEIATIAVTNGLSVLSLDEKFHNNRDLILLSVKKEGLFLKYYKEFQDDEEIVLEAVRQNPLALEYASTRMRSNKKIAEEAIKQDNEAYLYISDDLELDNNFTYKMLAVNPYVIYYAPSHIQRNFLDFYFWCINREGTTFYIKDRYHDLSHLINEIFYFIFQYENKDEIIDLLVNTFIIYNKYLDSKSDYYLEDTQIKDNIQKFKEITTQENLIANRVDPNDYFEKLRSYNISYSNLKPRTRK